MWLHVRTYNDVILVVSDPEKFRVTYSDKQTALNKSALSAQVKYTEKNYKRNRSAIGFSAVT